ncbi:isoprenylcysteine carboxylmethyltransferase family protein [uncultured Paracoccus sp.]|uniref:methyltransferase family protein n=1 Tax=uncultured Paracoccus sp. TaxID=189685 RepID=UPI0025EA34AA|nr:isoprenylcysteine carboxylmethyltransferase family protein [uncultured Paracoccus sp.]
MARLAALPQFWLAAFVVAGMLLGRLWPVALPKAVQVAGLGVTAAGIGLMMWAAATMTRARTSFMPGLVPKALVTDGPFRFSRNPIYLGDLLVMGGVLLALQLPVGLVLLPVFAQALTRFFILPEERVIEAEFGQGFRDYKARVRRWL